MKHQTNQIPIKKPIKKGNNKSKITLGISPNKFRNASRRKGKLNFVHYNNHIR